jgi:flagellin
VLDGSYDATIRAGNTNAETIRVAVGSLKAADTAQIEAHATEKAVRLRSTTGSATVLSTNAQNMMEAQEGKVVTIDTSLWSDTFKAVFKADSLGTFSIAAAAAVAGDDDNDEFTIDAKTGKISSIAEIDYENLLGAASADDHLDGADANGEATKANGQYQLVATYTNRAGTAHTETIEVNIVKKDNTELDDIKVETAAEASRAIETLDKALEEVSTAQAKLGAIQNRLTHNIDNLSKGSMLTEQSVGRIVDADFATETSELSKQQILAQAATSMLAQANQSKQSVLALLQ